MRNGTPITLRHAGRVYQAMVADVEDFRIAVRWNGVQLRASVDYVTRKGVQRKPDAVLMASTVYVEGQGHLPSPEWKAEFYNLGWAGCAVRGLSRDAVAHYAYQAGVVARSLNSMEPLDCEGECECAAAKAHAVRRADLKARLADLLARAG